MKLNTNVSKTAVVVALALGTTAVVAAGIAGGTTEAAFADILTEVKGWLSGAPGKIVAVLAFGAAMFNVVKQNFIAAIGAFLGAMMMAYAGPVIETIFSAGI
jgi:hypothetical protein